MQLVTLLKEGLCKLRRDSQDDFEKWCQVFEAKAHNLSLICDILLSDVCVGHENAPRDADYFFFKEWEEFFVLNFHFR